MPFASLSSVWMSPELTTLGGSLQWLITPCVRVQRLWSGACWRTTFWYYLFIQPTNRAGEERLTGEDTNPQGFFAVIAACQGRFWIAVAYSKRGKESVSCLEDVKQVKCDHNVKNWGRVKGGRWVSAAAIRGHDTESLRFVLPSAMSYPTSFMGF